VYIVSFSVVARSSFRCGYIILVVDILIVHILVVDISYMLTRLRRYIGSRPDTTSVHPPSTGFQVENFIYPITLTFGVYRAFLG